ncbi:MAG: carboxylating nicotinate-nucleotide diphosphorylase [Reichenbachiella sp.]
MKIDYLSKQAVRRFIDSALKEDVGDGDHTTLASIPPNLEQEAKITAKSDGVVAGIELAQWIFQSVDPTIEIETSKVDGDQVIEGDLVLLIKGKARSILTAERLVLNCMQRMSGIATYTQKLSSLIKHTKTKLLDTRKTSPNFRICEKWAVKIGGGVNHRFGLYDMILLKDNHIDYAGGVKKAISSTKKYLKEANKDLKIEVETRSLEEVEQVLECGGVDVIMLDNMLPSAMNEAVRMINGTCQTEASGGITEKNIKEMAETGVDFISVGALTHSYESMDLSLTAIK